MIMGIWPISVTTNAQTLRLIRIVLNMVLTAAVYYALAAVGTVLSVAPSDFAIIWPATAFLVSVLVLSPMRHWWLYLLAVIPAHFHMVYTFENAELPSIVILTQLTGNFSLGVITALVVRSTSELPLRFENFRTALSFILLAGVAVPAVVNALILSLHLWTGWAIDFWAAWRQWMLASVFPTVTIPPLMIVASHRHLFGGRTDVQTGYTELVLLTVVLLVACMLVFGWDHPQPQSLPVLFLAPFPLLLWSAVRLGVGGTCLSLLVVAGAASASALAGRGPFALPSRIEDVLALQVFLTAISVPLVLLAALVEEQIQTGNTLRASEQRLLNLQQDGQQRIAQELHDSTSQHLTAMALNLTALRSKAGEDAAALIKEISDSLREATRELVSFGYLLHPAEVQRDGLHSTLRRYVDGFARRTQLEVKFRAAGTIDELPLAVQEALLRIVQEALANVYRHASASRVTIKFSYVRQRLHVVIVDDGVGIEDTPLSGDRQASSLGVGIPGMKVRARRLGGKIDVRSRPGGTVVHAVLPI